MSSHFTTGAGWRWSSSRPRSSWSSSTRRSSTSRCPSIGNALRLLPGQPVVGRQRLHAHLRRLPAARRAHGRPARPPPHVHRRPDPLRRRFACRRARPERRLVDRRPRRPGPWRRAALPRRALARDRRCSPKARSATRRSASGARSPAPAARRACCSAACSPSGPAGSGCSSSTCRSASPPRCSRRACCPRARNEGARHFDIAGAVTVTAGLSLLVYSLVNANEAGWGSGETLVLLGARASCCSSRFVLIELRTKAPLVPFPGIFRLRTIRGINITGAADRDGAVLDVLLHLALHAAGARLRRARGRPRLPAAGGRDHRLGRHRVEPRHPLRRQAGADRRPAADRDRPAAGSRRSRPAAPTSATSCSRR